VTFFKALRYFAQEATLNLFRSWKVSLLAILTITVSLFLAGTFLLVSGNLRRVIEGWREESKIVVYLEPGADEASRRRIRSRLEEVPGVSRIDEVSAENARRRFREAFPSMADLLEGWGEDPLPASLEVSLDWRRLADRSELAPWLRELRNDPAVTMVDDDRDWLQQLQAVVLVIEGLGMVLGAVLLLTAIFTISSVIRLTAYLYRDEIAVMRLVGATEFFIRGPFYVEGLFQGLAGGALAVGSLFGLHRLVVGGDAGSRPDAAGSPLLASVLAEEFLSGRQVVLLVGLGALAGVVGAVTSLRREELGAPTAEGEGAEEAWES